MLEATGSDPVFQAVSIVAATHYSLLLVIQNYPSPSSNGGVLKWSLSEWSYFDNVPPETYWNIHHPSLNHTFLGSLFFSFSLKLCHTFPHLRLSSVYIYPREPEWTCDEKICARTVNNELQFYENNDFSEYSCCAVLCLFFNENV